MSDRKPEPRSFVDWLLRAATEKPKDDTAHLAAAEKFARDTQGLFGWFGRASSALDDQLNAALRQPRVWRFAQWLGGIRRLGHRGPLKRALTAMLEEMSDDSFNAVLGELIEDSIQKENVLTGLRESGATDLRVIGADTSRITYSAGDKIKSVTLRRLENLLSEIRAE